MNELINRGMVIVNQIPLPLWLGAGGGFIVLVILAAVLISRRRLIRTALRKMDLGESDPVITAKLLSRPSLVESLIRRKGEDVIAFFGIADHLVRRLQRRKKADDAKRILSWLRKTVCFQSSGCLCPERTLLRFSEIG
jgi:hypothetical protein